MSEQQTTSACPHPEAVGKRWGDPISEERQAQLDTQAKRQRTWAEQPPEARGNSPLKMSPSPVQRSSGWLSAPWLVLTVMQAPWPLLRRAYARQYICTLLP